MIQEYFMGEEDYLYIFLDEGGNLDFSNKGSKYFILTCVSKKRPFTISPQLDNDKYDLLEYGLNFEYFHCAEDNTHVRKKVFSRVIGGLSGIEIDALIVEKRKTGPSLREDKQFYPRMLGYLLKHVVKKVQFNSTKEIIVITDSIPVQKKKKAIEKSIKQTLSEMLPDDCRYRVMHHASKSSYSLQIADYCNWALFRKWERGDTEYYDKILPAIRSEYNIFKNGACIYY